MDHLIAGIAVTAQQVFQGELPASLTGIIVRDDDFLIFTSCPLRHTIWARGPENKATILIEIANVFLIVIRNNKVPLTPDEHIVKPLVILQRELYRIAALCHIVGRIAVKYGILPVILANQLLKVLILNDNIGQPAGALPNQMEEAADIAGLTAKGLGAAAETVSHQLEVICGTANISAWRWLPHQAA